MVVRTSSNNRNTKGREDAVAKAQKKLTPRAEALRPILLDIIRDRGFGMNAWAIAAELNRRKVETLRPGSRWHPQTVIRIRRRLGI